MAIILLLILAFCVTVLIMHRRLIYILADMESKGSILEARLRDILPDEECDLLVELYEIYCKGEKIEEIEIDVNNYKQSVERYISAISVQPWKALAWICKLPQAEPIVNPEA